VASCIPGHEARDAYLRGWCCACYSRWRRHGKPAAGPPPPRRPGPPPKPGPCVLGRIAEWQFVCARMTDQAAAARLGVSERTIERYRAIVRYHLTPQQEAAA